MQIILADGTIQPQAAAEQLQHIEDIFTLICSEQCYGINLGLLSCIQMLRSYYLWLADQKGEAFFALDKALSHAGQLDELRRSTEEYYISPLLHYVRINIGEASADCEFSAELPDLWPWWDVPNQEAVKRQMQDDSRWADWERRARG